MVCSVVRVCCLLISLSFVGPAAAQWSANSTEIVVVGVPHFRHANIDEEIIKKVQASLTQYKPDLVAVEWLHPTVATGDVETYTELGDVATLARLWGIKTKNLPEQILEVSGKVAAGGENEIANRIQLGKLRYLAGDALNAGYQWWIADQLGGDTAELSRLTRKNFAGDEFRVLGFHAAHKNNHEYMSPFDYQGDDAAWGSVYEELLEAVAESAVPRATGQTEGERTDQKDAFLNLMQSDPEAWLKANKQNAAVKDFAMIVEWQLSIKKKIAAESKEHALGEIGYFQTKAAIDVQNRLYYQDLWELPHAGLGRQLVVNYERRNEKMASFVEADARRLGASRILVIVGAGHKLFLDKIFAERDFAVLDSNSILK